MKMTKQKILTVLMFLLVIGALGAVACLVFKQKQFDDRTISQSEVKKVIGEDGLYVSEENNLTIDFPKSWTGCLVDEGKDRTTFSLKNTAGEYVPVLAISKIVWGETVPDKAYVLGGSGNFNTIIAALEDKNAAQFGGVFAASDYPGIDTDLRDNIVPTAKFIRGLRETNEFRLSDVKVGDQIGLMKIASISTSNDGKNVGEGYAYSNPKSITIKFSGEVTLTGTYQYGNFDLNTRTFGDICIMDDAENSILPRLVQYGDQPVCFTDQEFAKASFMPEGSSGEVQVRIDDFTINYSADGTGTNTAKLLEVLPSNAEVSKPIDTSSWSTFTSKNLGISLKTPKEVYDYGVGMAALRVTEDNAKKTINISYGSEGSSIGLELKVASAKDNSELDAIINTWLKEKEVGSGCRLGATSPWAGQAGVFEAKVQGEDWNNKEIDLGSTTCGWNAPLRILYYPAKQKAILVELGQDARFYGDEKNSISYDGDIVDSIRFN